MTPIGLGLAIGESRRCFDLTLPAPPRLAGALLVRAMTRENLQSTALQGDPREAVQVQVAED